MDIAEMNSDKIYYMWLAHRLLNKAINQPNKPLTIEARKLNKVMMKIKVQWHSRNVYTLNNLHEGSFGRKEVDRHMHYFLESAWDAGYTIATDQYHYGKHSIPIKHYKPIKHHQESNFWQEVII